VGLGRGSPGPPTAPLGAGQLTPVCHVLLSVLCLLACGVVPRTPSPSWGRQLATLLPLGNQAHHVPPVLGLRPASSLTLWGAETPPRLFLTCPYHQQAVAAAILTLRGFCQSVTFPHSTCGAPSPPSPLIHLPTHGGVGARGMPSRTPPTLPPHLPAVRDWGGDPSIRVPSLSLMVARVPRTPPLPRLGAGSKHLGSAVD